MFYVWLFFENRFKDFYLPDTEKWSKTIALRQAETGWDQDYFIPIRALDRKCYVSCASKFRWLDLPEDTKELPVYNGCRYYMQNGSFKLGLMFTACDRTDTAFKKFLLPKDQDITLGRDENCVLQVSPSVGVVSKKQGTFRLRQDGVCIYTDYSKNGSYLNGLPLNATTTRLRFGDTVTLSAGIKFIYLGTILAINRMTAFESINMMLADPPASRPLDDSRHCPSVTIQHHRAPRFLQKPNDMEVRIDPPLEKQHQNQMPLWLTLGPSTTMVLPMLMGSAISSSRGGFMGAGLAMVGTASALAVFWSIMNTNYRKKQAREVEDLRVSRYAMYIAEAEQYLRELNTQEYNRLLETCPSVEQCAQFPQSSSYRLWERMPKHADFMSVRVGLGRVPLPNNIAINDVKLSLIDDPLRDEPARLADTYGTIPNAPVTVDLRHETIVGILGEDMAISLGQSLLLQLAALHSYHDVRIAVITDESVQSRWAWTRWLPHVFASEDRQLRMVVSEPNAIQEVLTHLDEVLLMRSEATQEAGENDGDADIPLPHYVVFCTNPELLENKPILRHMLSKSWGMTLVLMAPSMELLPKECHIVLDAGSRSGAIYTSEGDVRKIDFEYPNLALLLSFSHMLAPLRVKDSVESAAIPTMVSFLDIYGVRRIDNLDVWRFWNENHVYEGLRSTIGLRAGSQPFVLDISDKSHGPHGLIAGTTGSGKSVMLQTYILSLALNYHPDQIRFILIDYKGGGMADAFRRLPHVTGIIDNLQTGNTIARALASIQGEIHRREHLFRKVGVNNIDDYIRFFYDDPSEERLPHLIIIVDEFAELKTDQPDFMRELVSASRVGRSLGVHLILSTQKPSNSVSDEIWANSNFRICLRVQSRSDSTEMLRRPDAAYLKNRGRCYVQVGNDEIYEQVQTSYSGLSYNPDEPSETELPHLLDNAGRRIAIKRQKAGSSDREITQMDAVLDRIIQTARDHGLPENYRLWMEELPSTIFLRSIPGSAEADRKTWAGPNTGEELRFVYAQGDDVHSQRQFPVWMDLMANRNHMVVGMASTGKTTFVQTAVMSLAMRYSPAALHMYILSLSSRVLNTLRSLPHVGEIVYNEETDELLRLIDLLEQEDLRRRNLFASASTDSFLAFNRSRPNDPVPSIVVFIDRFAQVTEMLGDNETYTQKLFSLIREGSGRGIFFVATAMKTNEIPYKIRDCFKGIGLQVNDRNDYIDIVGSRMPSDMPDIAQFPGRGLAALGENLYEIQIALAGSSASDVERADDIIRQCRALDEDWNGPRPARIPRIPENPTWNDFSAAEEYQAAQKDPWLFPIAYDKTSGQLTTLHLDTSFSFLISGPRQSGKTNLLRLIAEQWHHRGAKIAVVGDESWNHYCRHLDAVLYDLKSKEWEEYVSWLNEEIKSRNQRRKAAQTVSPAELNRVARAFEPVVILIDDMENFISQNPQIANKLFADVASRAAKFGIYMYAAISHASYAQVRMLEPMVTLVRQQRGIALGGKLSDCDPWNISMPYAKKNAALPLGEAYLFNNGDVSHVIFPKAPDLEV